MTKRKIIQKLHQKSRLKIIRMLKSPEANLQKLKNSISDILTIINFINLISKLVTLFVVSLYSTSYFV